MMNKIVKQAGLLCLLWIVASCNKAPEYYTLETPVDQMFLKASSTDITLEKAKEQESAVTFTWEEASDRGADAKITYFLRMYMVELNTNVTQLYEVEKGERSISFTHTELNDILIGWGMKAGEKVTIEAEVIAQVSSSDKYRKPELSKTRLNAVGYIKNVTAVYMIVITEDGERSTRRITEKIIGSGVYQSSVELVPCKYFFSLSSDADYPGYVKGDNGENSLQYVAEEGTYEMFENTLTGTYTAVIDLNQLDVNMVSIYVLPKDGIWMIGNACDVGWDTANARAKGAFENKDPRHPERWTYTGNFYADGNEFKLMLENDYSGKFFFAPYQAANPATEHELGLARYQGDGGDIKWSVAASGKYTLTVDLAQMKIDLTPAE